MDITAAMISLLAWLAVNTNYTIPTSERDLPIVEYRTPAEFQTTKGFGDVWATYDPVTNVIHLRKPFDVSDPVYRSVLLHELVHFLQTRNGKQSICRGFREAEAYDLEFQWLKEQGFQKPLYDPFLVQQLKMDCMFPTDATD